MHNTKWLSTIAAIVVLGGLPDAPAQAQTFQRNVKFCNHTRNTLNVAAGYDRVGSSETTSRGWTVVRSCTCRDIFSAPLKATEVFLYASRNGTADSAIDRAGGFLCINPDRRFLFVGQNRNAGSCASAGGRWVQFAHYDTDTATNYTVRLRGANACNL